jgi:hypothetical protein
MTLGKKDKKTNTFLNDKSYKQMAILCIIQPLAVFPWLGEYASLPNAPWVAISSIFMAVAGCVLVRPGHHLTARSRGLKVVTIAGGLMSSFIIIAGVVHVLSLVLVMDGVVQYTLSRISTWIVQTWFSDPFVASLWILLGVATFFLSIYSFLLRTKAVKRLQFNARIHKVPKSRMVATVSLVGLVLLLLILGGLGSGKLQYGLAYVRCGGAPISASRFMASYSYTLPTDKTYSPNIFSEYYCTQAEAEKSGFRRSVLTDAVKKESEALSAQRTEEKRFSPEKVNYTLYVPTEKYTYGEIKIYKMSNMDPHSIFNVKEDGYNVASVREGAIPSSYQLCKIEKYVCTSIGKDKRGGQVMKQVSGRENDIASYATNIDNTFITLTGVDKEKTDADIIDIFNSLGEYKNV